MPRKIKAIVAKYHEDMSWLDTIREHIDVVVYDKSQYYLNVGREAETFARGILDSWTDLLEDRVSHMVFLQGNPFDHVPKDRLADLLAEGTSDVVPLGRMHTSDAMGRPDHPGLAVGQAWTTVLGEAPRDAWTFVAGAQYIVPKDRILERGYAFWQRVHALLYEERVCPWTMERFWYHLFC